MGVIGRLWGAAGRLADALNALASTVGETDARLRERLGLDQEAPALPGPVAERLEAPAPEPEGNGRRRVKAAKE